MDRHDFTNRRADKVSLNRSKQVLWQHIQKKAVEKKPWYDRFFNFFRHHTFSLASAMATIMIVLVVAYSFNFSVLSPIPVHASFEMTAEKQDRTGVDANTTFTLTASEEVSVKAIEQNLQVTPQLDFELKETGEKTYQLIPKQALEPETVYHFSIVSEIEGKPQEFSWAYQVKHDFKVTGTIPGDKTAGVPVDTGIEINFSFEGFDFAHAQDYFEISPETAGRFEEHQKTLSFIPGKSLKPGTIYTVTVKKGLPLLDSDQALQDDLVFEFETATGNNESNVDSLRFQQEQYEVGEGQPMGFKVSAPYNFKESLVTKILEENSVESENPPSEEASPQEPKLVSEPPSIPVDIYRFKDEEQYIDFLQQTIDTPEWAFASQQALWQALSKTLTPMGQADAFYDEVSWQDYIYLPTTELEKGFYLFEIQDKEGDVSDHALVQITNLSSYVDVTKKDTLFWVNDVKTEKPVKDARIELVGTNEVLGESDAQGILQLKTPDALESTRETNIIKISSQDNVLIYIKPSEYEVSSIGRGNYWYSFTTDRPVYKPNDKIKFWGFIQPKNDRVTTDHLSLQIVNEDAVVAEKALDLSPNHTFIGEFELKNLRPTYYDFRLMQGEKMISQEYFEIQNYQKPAYQIDVKSQKSAVFAGEQMDFEVQTSFFDGTPLPHLDLTYNDDWNEGDLQTDAEGHLVYSTLAKPTEKRCNDEGNYCTNEKGYYLTVAPKLGESDDIEGGANVMVFNSKLTLKSEATAQDGQATVNVSAYAVDLDQYEKNGEAAGKTLANRKIKGEIYQLKWEKTESGQYYDFVQKKVVKTYDYRTVKKGSQAFEVETDANGNATYTFETDSENEYHILLSAEDDDGNPYYEDTYVYNGLDRGYDNYNIRFQKNLDTQERLEGQVAPYNVGDTVYATFANDATSLASDTKGQFLFLQSSNGLQEYAIEDGPNYEFEFTQKDIPNIYVGGVWFTGQNYIKAYPSNAIYDKQLKELSIEINTKKPTYQPGDEVALEVKVTDKKGKPVAAEVNLNLVDEAYYESVYDALNNPLDDLYSNNEMGILYDDNSHQNPLFITLDSGKGGCFVAGTKIWMADGTYKNIEDIHEGDIIRTKATALSSEMVTSKVIHTVSHEVSEYLVLNENLKVTAEHILFVNGKFQVAGRVKVGDQLLNKEGQWVKVHSVHPVTQKVKVYNFEVEHQHTYFANGFYVHNDKGDVVRTDFKDNALFESIQTDATGKGSVTFKLPDNITSWRVTAKAIDAKNLQAGMGAGSVPVSLPLFVDAVFNPQYSINDKPTVKVRAFGDSLKAGDEVAFSLDSTSLKASEKATGEAFQPTYFDLPALGLGEHDLVLKATSGSLIDGIKQFFTVVASRLNQRTIDFVADVKNDTVLKKSEVLPSQVTFIDGGRGGFYKDLIGLYFTDGDRLDQRLARIGATELLNAYFEQQLMSESINPGLYQQYGSNAKTVKNITVANGGLKLLPYGDADLELTVLTLLMDGHPERFGQFDLKDYLQGIYENQEVNLDELVMAMAGLAALHEPVLNSLETIKNESSLTVKDKLYIGLAFQALGDKEKALEMYHENSNYLEEGAQFKALAAVLGAALNDDQAESIWQSALKEQQPDEFLALHELGYLKNRLKFAVSTPVKFQFIKNGKARTVTLKKGEISSELILPQDNISVKVLSGQLAATLESSKVVNPADFETDSKLGIRRLYSVNGKATSELNEGDMVRVHLEVSFEAGAKNAVYRITDILPSGLTPVSAARAYAMSSSDNERTFNYPYQINGQEVNFIMYPWPNLKEGQTTYQVKADIAYYARVVGPGTYYADPAKVESFDDPSVASISEPATIEIGKMEE